VFDLSLARIILPYLALSFALGGALTAQAWTRVRRTPDLQMPASPERNPLALGSAAVFALLFVAMSLLTAWFSRTYGSAGVLTLAVVSGASDIDPFLLNLVQGASSGLPEPTTCAAILLAVASNNAVKAGYALAFGGSGCRRAAMLLFLLALSSLPGVGVLLRP
jgi:uncharacterized membrane protein (DUF4010 family)